VTSSAVRHPVAIQDKNGLIAASYRVKRRIGASRASLVA